MLKSFAYNNRIDGDPLISSYKMFSFENKQNSIKEKFLLTSKECSYVSLIMDGKWTIQYFMAIPFDVDVLIISHKMFSFESKQKVLINFLRMLLCYMVFSLIMDGKLTIQYFQAILYRNGIKSCSIGMFQIPLWTSFSCGKQIAPRQAQM